MNDFHKTRSTINGKLVTTGAVWIYSGNDIKIEFDQPVGILNEPTENCVLVFGSDITEEWLEIYSYDGSLRFHLSSFDIPCSKNKNGTFMFSEIRDEKFGIVITQDGKDWWVQLDCNTGKMSNCQPTRI